MASPKNANKPLKKKAQTDGRMKKFNKIQFSMKKGGIHFDTESLKKQIWILFENWEADVAQNESLSIDSTITSIEICIKV